MKVKHLFDNDINRYNFDSGMCHFKKGWAQCDTSGDASYFGKWANPKKRAIVTFCEGDITIVRDCTPDEFCSELRYAANSWEEFNIDGMCEPDIINRFKELGLSDLLH